MTSDDGFIIELLIKKNLVPDNAVQSAREAMEDAGEVLQILHCLNVLLMT